MTTLNDSDAAAIIARTDRTTEPLPVEPGQIYLVTDEDGHRDLVDTDSYVDRPRLYSRSVIVHDAASLIAYIDRHTSQEDGVEVWVSPGNDGRTPIVKAVLDANGRRVHIASVAFEKTPEWRDWLDISGNMQDQLAFAEFVEDHVDDILTPSGATMLELAQSIRSKGGSTFKSDKRLASGQAQLEYTENVDATAGKAGTITIPEEIELKLQPFQGAALYKVHAKFRYRINRGDLALGVKVMRPEVVVQAVLDDVHGAIVEGLPDALVVLGRA